jgi:NAD(P)-dependent dehydrogenase (short-subunit alcohol dehydrogenase family)
MAATKWTVQQIPSQTGKTALVTGANSGIGYQAALVLARHGAHVLLACRNAAKGLAALERLKREAPGAAAELVEVDMASLASIRSFATAFAGRGIPLDLLINNAGVMALPKREVTVASLAHRNGKIDFDNLQSERGYKPLGAYGESKLANILFAKELNRRAWAAHSNLISLAVHPGISMTNIMVNGPGTKNLQAIVLRILAPIIIQPDDAGALLTLYAATSPDAKGGEYIGPDGFQEFKGSPVVVQPRANGLDEAVGKRLWTVSEELTGVVYPALG